ncbi:phosphotransferase [Candidatus Woesebacteria bacterium]|nr:phosphotransferase [Candidatus Woesebacteria bacterium]
MINVDHKKLRTILKQKFELNIVDTQQAAGSYIQTVLFVKDDNNQIFVLKILKDINREFDLPHHSAQVAFSKFLNTQLSSGFRAVSFIPNIQGETITHIDEDDFIVLFQKEEIIKKVQLSHQETKELGSNMRVMHEKLANFSHVGLGTTNYMRVLSDDQIRQLPTIFPNIVMSEYSSFLKALNYRVLGLSTTVLHGDIHQENVSFTNRPVLMDLDTLCRGSGIEEIARTITHWHIDEEEIGIFYENLLTGYGPLTEIENSLLPKLIIAQLLRKYFEFLDYNDRKNSLRIKKLFPIFIKAFDTD